jgi:hypothetical protein
MWKSSLLAFALIMSALMLTGGFSHAASWLPTNKQTLDRSSNLVVKVKKKHHHHHGDGDNNTSQQGERSQNTEPPPKSVDQITINGKERLINQ